MISKPLLRRRGEWNFELISLRFFLENFYCWLFLSFFFVSRDTTSIRHSFNLKFLPYRQGPRRTIKIHHFLSVQVWLINALQAAARFFFLLRLRPVSGNTISETLIPLGLGYSFLIFRVSTICADYLGGVPIFFTLPAMCYCHGVNFHGYYSRSWT